MNGADVLCDSLLELGVDTCFANPGTSEMHFVAALDRKPELRCVLGLSEGVVTGAADGYARMLDRPAATLLHLGPGLGNGLANLHNARRAHTPILNIVGDHASYHLANDPPLASDIESLAWPVSCFVKRVDGPDSIEADIRDGWQAAMQSRGVSTIILPGDAAWNDAAGTTASGRPEVVYPLPEPLLLDQAIAAVRSGRRCVLLLGGPALRADCLDAAGRIAGAGVRLMSEPSNSRIERRPGQASLSRTPYVLDDVVDTFREIEVIITVGARPPLAFFAYPGKPTHLYPAHAKVIELCPYTGDCLGTLQAFSDAVGQTSAPCPVPLPIEVTEGPLTEEIVARVVARELPENAIVCDESITSCRSFFAQAEGRVTHDYLQLTGGAIGIGIPLAVGAALACPERPVITLQADGSAMYTVQGLWTQARENLNIVTVLLSNRAYAILQGEMRRVGVNSYGQNARRMLELSDPDLNWVGIAESLGVSATRATTTEQFVHALRAALASRGPHLIEAVI